MKGANKMRDINQLHPVLQKKVKELQLLCELKGYKIGISECLRTVAEQDALYAKGRTTAGVRVTNAKGSSYSSMHQWGVAFDVYRNDGKGAYNDSDGFFSKVGALGISIGLEWGGTWKNPQDKPHFQLPDWGSTPANLRRIYGTPQKFMNTWNKPVNEPVTTSQSYPTIKQGSKNKYVGILQQKLNELGYDCGKADSIFGAKTKKALERFQFQRGLVVDGICGKNTWKELLK